MWSPPDVDTWCDIKNLKTDKYPIIITPCYKGRNKGETQMKKVMLALFAVMTLAACTGSYKSGNCEYDFLLHKDISISKIIGNATGGC